MNSIRKWLYRPKRMDTSYLAQFYFADEDLNTVASELDSFDGRKDPERCTMLVNQLRVCQDKVLTVIQKIMEDAIPTQRANRDFRVKFPDDVLQDSLAGQLWFGAECLAAGSSILNREVESASMRPLARALTKNLDSLRCILREQCLRSVTEYTDRIREALVIFDKLFAEFELSYVSAMVPVKTMKEYDMLQEVTVLFSETVHRAQKIGLLSQDMIDDYDPALMFTIPRLAIVCGLLIYPEGPLNPDMDPTSMTEMYRPFQTLLYKIRELLYTLSNLELSLLEKSLCSSEEPEVSTGMLCCGQTETLLQIDQGFDEGGEGLVAMNGLGSGILMHSAGSGSPVTPINTDNENVDFEAISPTSTIVEGNFSFTSPTIFNRLGSEEMVGNLNKSESQDSGLHSENVSTSDTVTVDCVPLTSQDGEVATAGCVTAVSDGRGQRQDLTLEISSCAEAIVSDRSDGNISVARNDSELCDNNEESRGLENKNPCLKSCSLDDESNVKHLCRSIVDEIVTSAVRVSDGANCDVGNCDSGTHQNPSDCNNHTDWKKMDKKKLEITNPSNVQGSEVVTGDSEVRVARQFSWQYNVQFAIPRISTTEQEVDAERRSNGSFSSDSTISDNSSQRESVADFVIESLATMTRTGSQSHTYFQSDNQGAGIQPEVAAARGQYSDKSTYHSLNQRQTISKPHSNESSNSSDSSREDSILPTNVVDYLDFSVAQNSQNYHSAATGVERQKLRHKRDRGSSLEHIHCKTGSQGEANEELTDVSSGQSLRSTESLGSASSCPSSGSCTSECDCDKDCSCAGSETSSYNSEMNDEEEIALAIQAAELASRSEARSRFRSSSDLIHRLFVCIAGVADQLQTNYASDLRHILKCVFQLNSTNLPEPDPDVEVAEAAEPTDIPQPETQGSNVSQPSVSQPSPRQIEAPSPPPHPPTRPPQSQPRIFNEPPEWVPDEEVETCTACKTPFTFVRRRHHCRNCGKIFCGKCSSTTVPLPQYGHQKPVRVCHRCFLYQVSHFTISD